MSSIKDDYKQLIMDYRQLIDTEQLRSIIQNDARGKVISGSKRQYAIEVLWALGIQCSKADSDIEHILGDYFNLKYTQNQEYRIQEVQFSTIFEKLLKLQKYRTSIIYMSDQGWQRLNKERFADFMVAFISIFFNTNLPARSVITQTFDSLIQSSKIPKAQTSNRYMQFKDCMFDVETGKVVDFDEEVVPRIRYDIELGNIQPAEKPPKQFSTFIKQVVEGDKAYEAFLYQMIGYIISPVNTDHYNGIFLYGPGANGKSAVLELITSFFFDTDVSLKNLSSFNSRFGLSGLDQKQIIISHESAKVTSNSIALSALKSILADGKVHIEEKGKNGRDAEVELKAIMATNEKIHFSQENLQAMRRRIVVLPFKHVVAEEDRDPDLKRKLFDERKEIMAFLLSKIQEVSAPGFQWNLPDIVVEEQAEWFSIQHAHVTNNPSAEAKVTNWVNQNITLEDENRIHVNELRDKIREDTATAISSQVINKVLKEKFEVSQQQSNGERYWKGIDFKKSNVINAFQRKLRK